jgi:hypothetical protein
VYKIHQYAGRAADDQNKGTLAHVISTMPIKEFPHGEHVAALAQWYDELRSKKDGNPEEFIVYWAEEQDEQDRVREARIVRANGHGQLTLTRTSIRV